MKKNIVITLVLGSALCLLGGNPCEKKMWPVKMEPNLPAVLAKTTPPGLPTAKLMVAEQEFTVELAFTNASREKGLMFRKTLAPSAGMLFIHSEEMVVAYWMKNTLIPLDILYLKADGTIAKIYTMPILPNMNIEDTLIPGYSSEVPVKYALEVSPGTAQKLSLKPGQKIKIPDKIAQIIAEPDRD